MEASEFFCSPRFPEGDGSGKGWYEIPPFLEGETCADMEVSESLLYHK